MHIPSSSKLRRELGLLAAITLVVGCVIGSGVFVKPGRVIVAVGDSRLALLAWVLGGLISLAGGLTLAEVAARIPKTGGVYTYIEELYGKWPGFLCGWVQTVVYGPGLMAALGLYFAKLSLPMLQVSEQWMIPIALATISFLALVNATGSKYGGMVQQVATFAKLIPIAFIAVAGLIQGGEPIVGQTTLTTTVSFSAAVLSTLWAYDGWMQVANVAGEMKNPSRDLPRAIIIGLVVVLVAYLAVNAALLQVLSTEKVAQLGEGAAGAAARVLIGDWGGKLIGVGILVSIFGSLNGNILSNPRVPFAMAERGELPFSAWIGRVNSTWGSPANAILFQTAIAAIMVMSGDPHQITDLAIFSLYIFFAMAFAGLFLLRQKQATPGASPVAGDQSSYRTPLYPFVPLIAIVGCVYILGSTAFERPSMALYSVGIALCGIPLRLLAGRR